jgi:SAM-dependent methyltransferase
MKVNFGSGKNYLKGYVNVDINPMWKPDIICDVSKAIPIGTENKCQEIIAHDVLEHIPDLVSAMTNCLDMLVEGGIMDISVPYYLSLGAWQDPTHVRAFNENSWLYYTDWFWYLGWKTHRFELVAAKSTFVFSEFGNSLKDKSFEDLLILPKAIDSMRVVLKKVPLTDTDKKTLEAYHGVHE